MKTFYEIYKDAYAQEVSDIHLVCNKAVQFRINGELSDYQTDTILSDKDIAALVDQISIPRVKDDLARDKDADYAFQFDSGHERIRVNVAYERGNLAVTARVIRAEIPTFEQIDLGKTEETLTRLQHGLVIICGPTGSGKSTTLATMLERINMERKQKIVTLEDPIEFMFENRQCIVQQREIGIDAPTFGSALRTVFRQDPDIIMVGEMRDKETVQETLRIAETGHLVFSTLHTSSAASTILRIVDIFEPHEQQQVRIQLAQNLRAIIFQQLVPGANGKRVAAREIMINNSATSNIIRTGNFEQLDTVLQTSSEQGMVTMARAFERLLKEKKITKEIYEEWRPQKIDIKKR